MAIKDQYDTFDMRTTSGADAHYANDRPPDDATFVGGCVTRARSSWRRRTWRVRGGRCAQLVRRHLLQPVRHRARARHVERGLGQLGAANLVTCAIGEETVVSIRWPAAVNSLVGLAPTQELVSRDGMMGAGLNMRVGPICRTVQDAAKILDVIAGYDPKDDMTVLQRGPDARRAVCSFATAQRLDGLRIGVVREYMNKTLFSKADEQSIDLVERAIADLRKLGATVVDPGPEGALFQACVAISAPRLLNAAFTRQFRRLFPVDAAGQPTGDHIATLLELAADPSRVPDGLSLRTFGGGFGAPGEDRYMMNSYLRERGDANIKSNADLAAKATFYSDPNFPDRRQPRLNAERAQVLDTSARVQRRFAMQTMLLQCMQEQRLDALVAPTATVPPRKLTSPREPAVNGRSPVGWSMLGQQGFPVITVPAGFTTEIWDRVREGDGTRLVGPIAARLPVGVDFVGRPFDEAMLFHRELGFGAHFAPSVPS